MAICVCAELVALVTALAGVSVLAFARTHKILSVGWLSIPFFILSATYVWYALAPVSAEIRATVTRSGLMVLSGSIAIILGSLSFWKNRRR